MGYGNNGSWSGGGSWSSKSQKSSNRGNSWNSIGSTSTETRFLVQKPSHLQTQSLKPSWPSPAGVMGFAGTSTWSLQRAALALEETMAAAQMFDGAIRNFVPPAPGHPPPPDRESFRQSTTMVDKAGQRTRLLEKKSVDTAAKVEQARRRRW